MEREIVVFDTEEKALVEHCLAVIEAEKPEESRYIKRSVDSLVRLGQAISQYPSILGRHRLGEAVRTVDTLIEMLCRRNDYDAMLYIPTKAVLGKTFLIAKINLFYMLKYLAETTAALSGKIADIMAKIVLNIFTLMSEEVFYSIMGDGEIERGLRRRAGEQLANIWEYRLNWTIMDYAPKLGALWEARKKLYPVFGTLMGTSELIGICQSLDPAWMSFLRDEIHSQDTMAALEEFIFGLTHEELLAIRDKMSSEDIFAVDKGQIETLLGRNHFYSNFDEIDPREMYRFYRQRKLNASYRQRALLPGPKKTVEEIFLGYLLS